MRNLALITEQVGMTYGDFRSFVLPSEQIALTETGLFDTGKNKFPIAPEGLDQFAGLTEIPRPFFQTLEPDHQAMVFNRRFRTRLSDQRIPKTLRIILNQDCRIIGFDDPDLLRVSPARLMEVLADSLPKGLSPEQIGVGGFSNNAHLLHISLFSPQSATEPQPGDIINGGVDNAGHRSGRRGVWNVCNRNAGRSIRPLFC